MFMMPSSTFRMMNDDDEDVPYPTEDPLANTCDNSSASNSDNHVVQKIDLSELDGRFQDEDTSLRDEQDEMEMIINQIELDIKPDIHLNNEHISEEGNQTLKGTSVVKK